MFAKVFVWIAGMFTTLSLSVLTGLKVADMFPGTTFHGGLFGTMTFPLGADYILVVSAIASVIVLLAGTAATAITFEQIADSDR